MGELDTIAIRVAILKILNDRVSAAFKAAKKDAADALGPEGRKNAVFDGKKLGSVSVSKTGRVTVESEEKLTRWVAERYPTEVETVQRVRPAFLDQIKKASADAGEPCTPFGDLDVPGIALGEPYPMFRHGPDLSALVDQWWSEDRLTLTGDVKELGASE